MKKKVISLIIVLMLFLGACAWILFEPLLTIPMERRAWESLYSNGKAIVLFKRDTGNWPKSLDEVTHLPTRTFNGIPFEYNSEKHTLALHAFYEKNPIRLISRGRYGPSQKSGDFTVELETIDKLNIAKPDTAPDDYFYKNNITSVIVTGQMHGTSHEER